MSPNIKLNTSGAHFEMICVTVLLRVMEGCDLPQGPNVTVACRMVLYYHSRTNANHNYV